MPLIALADADERDPLDDYIESHVHAGVLLARDVEAIVLDASYRGTPVETAARRLPFPLDWYPGYRLTVTALRRHADYRGPEYADLGTLLTPRILGDAARTGRYDLQDLKMVWHALARFGAPEGAGTAYRPAATPCGPDRDTATSPGPGSSAAASSSTASPQRPTRSGNCWTPVRG